MSISATKAVWLRARAKGAAHHVLLAFADFADDDGLCWPSAATIARVTRRHVRNAKRTIAALVAAGELIPIGRKTRGVIAYRIACLDTAYVSANGSTGGEIATPDQCRNRHLSKTTGGEIATPLVAKSPPDPVAKSPSNPSLTVNEPLESSSTGKQAVCLWNELADELGLVRVQRLTPSRRSALDARLAEAGGVDGWRAALDLVRSTPFLRGENESGWRVTFDWLIDETNFARILENSYETWVRPTNGDGRADGSRISRKRANHDAFFAALAAVATRK